MEQIILTNKTSSGDNLKAIFLPEKGMNLISYKKNEIEVIDQSTLTLFEERYAGLGALIGPHFHHRKTDVIPPIKDESLFPHIARLKAKGIQEPFSHGIARYAPWKAEATSTEVKGVLTGKDTWNGVPLSSLEGQNFTMRFHAELLPEGLKLHLSVVSDADSLVGIHYYYHLPKGSGFVTSQVQQHYWNQEVKTIPQEWLSKDLHGIKFDLAQSADYTFYPYPVPLEGNIILDALDYRLITRYVCPSQENAWQLYHPQGASFVCIEPISAQDPRHPNLTASSLEILLTIG
jgi:hypothetical protein